MENKIEVICYIVTPQGKFLTRLLRTYNVLPRVGERVHLLPYDYVFKLVDVEYDEVKLIELIEQHPTIK